MNKNIFLIFVFLFLLNFVSSANCFSDYKCGEWSSCVEGLSTRICIDTKCGGEDITERQLCGEEDCEPAIECGDWSSCNLFDKTNDIINEQLIFEGVKERICKDKANCIDSFVEQERCSFSTPINVKKTEWCGEELVEIFDDKGDLVGRVKQKDVANKLKRVDISLIEESFPVYCSYCFDGEMNYDEEGVDCGGPSCPVCVEKIDFFDWAHLLSFFSWGIFGLLFFIGVVVLGRNEEFNQGLKNLIYLFKPLNREEALAREEKIKEFFVTKKISSEGFKNY